LNLNHVEYAKVLYQYICFFRKNKSLYLLETEILRAAACWNVGMLREVNMGSTSTTCWQVLGNSFFFL